MRGPAGEGQEEDPFRGHALFYEMRHPVDQRAGLSGAGAGDDEEGAGAVGGRRGLFAVQLRGEVAGRGVDTTLAGGIDQGQGEGEGGGSDVAGGHGGKISLRDGFGSCAVREVTPSQSIGDSGRLA